MEDCRKKVRHASWGGGGGGGGGFSRIVCITLCRIITTIRVECSSEAAAVKLNLVLDVHTNLRRERSTSNREVSPQGPDLGLPAFPSIRKLFSPVIIDLNCETSARLRATRTCRRVSARAGRHALEIPCYLRPSGVERVFCSARNFSIKTPGRSELPEGAIRFLEPKAEAGGAVPWQSGRGGYENFSGGRR